MVAQNDQQLIELCEALGKLDELDIGRGLRPVLADAGAFLEAVESLNPKRRILRFIGTISDRLTTEEVIVLARAIGAPPRFFTEAVPFRDILIKKADSRITMALADFIDMRSAREAREGISLNRHNRMMSQFRFVRWLPDDHGLSDTLELLSRRTDTVVESIFVRYLSELPWGADRTATLTLLKIMVDKPCDAYRLAIRQAVQREVNAGSLRLQLLQALFQECQSEATVLLVRDLNSPMSVDLQFNYLNQLIMWLGNEASKVESSAVRTAAIQSFASVNTGTWSRLGRGMLAEFFRKVLPEANDVANASSMDRFLCFILTAFQYCRLDHMGCIVSGPICFTVAFVTPWLLNRLMGPPPAFLRYLDLVAILCFLIPLIGTTTTHFSGRETLPQRLRLAMFFWSSILLFPLILIGVRLYSLIHH